ncbi:MAG: crossover junction endodeoxyribonuclease RuvC, partial [Firmicutes bacterium]|nr:crossover junction endodeoxyribonuclease RuvC [Bacillota bacterium]
MRVIGVDPGTAICGWGVVDGGPGGALTALAYGAVRTPAGRDPGARLTAVYDGIRAVIARWRPERAVVEKLFFGTNATSALAVGQARGVVLLALAQAGVPVLELSPAEVKQALTGYGRAGKAQM